MNDKITPEFVQYCISEAEQCRSKLTPEAVAINGKCGLYIKHLLNNLCNRHGTRHFDFGTGTGSSIITASFKNEGTFYTVDNYTKGIHNRSPFVNNTKRFQQFCCYDFIEKNIFDLDLPALIHCNSLFWDGLHSEQGTCDSIVFADPLFDPVFVMVLDDWNYPQTRKGWEKAQAKMRYQILFEKIISTDFSDTLINDNHSTFNLNTMDAIIDNDPNNQMYPWWNGVYIAVLAKRRMYL